MLPCDFVLKLNRAYLLKVNDRVPPIELLTALI